MKPRAPLLAALLLLTSCGLRPLYSGGGAGAVAQSLTAIEVLPIEGRAGWLVRTALQDRIRNAGGAARYRLQIELDDQITGLGLRSDNAITRERRTLRARYQLLDTTQNIVVLDASAGADAGIDVVRSEFATIVAEQAALERLSTDLADQIVGRVALYVRRSQARQ